MLRTVFSASLLFAVLVWHYAKYVLATHLNPHGGFLFLLGVAAFVFLVALLKLATLLESSGIIFPYGRGPDHLDDPDKDPSAHTSVEIDRT